MNGLYKIVAVVLLSLGLIGGCGGGGGGGDACDFSIDEVTNGPDSFNAFSLWACTNELDEEFNFQVFDNGAGFSDGIGIFTWVRTGCRSVSVDGELASGDITNLVHTHSEIEFIGLLAFDEQLNQVPINSVICVLVVF